ncbi:MAG: efflux RND transporter periplasmic adaptor subunit [Deltaproteobacteria bacterium]|nr:efflux RND transporter periplasmic adaptor subunit [Deltaproteobacteria bacterium]
MSVLHRLLPALVALTACSGKAPPEGGGAPGAGGPGGSGPPPATPVGVVKVEARPLALTTELPGRTVASLVAEIRPQVGGLIARREFTEGADVDAGVTLYMIDRAPYEVGVALAKAQLQRAEAGYATARTRSGRLDALAREDIVAAQDKDDASGAARAARADIALAKAALDKAELDLTYTEIKAPIAGRIGRSLVTQGALVAPYQPQALAVIQQLDPIHVDITRSSVELLRLRAALASGSLVRDAAGHAEVRLVLEDGSEYPHVGRLEMADAAVDPTTGSVVLRATFPNPDKVLLPGMFVRAIVAEGTRPDALLVPQQGVTRDPRGRAIALVAGADGTAAERVLEVERTVGDQWLVRAGVTPGEQVIVEGLQMIRAGAPVAPHPASFLGKDAAPAESPGQAPGKPPEDGAAPPAKP